VLGDAAVARSGLAAGAARDWVSRAVCETQSE
jgi:hypothetical protein